MFLHNLSKRWWLSIIIISTIFCYVEVYFRSHCSYKSYNSVTSYVGYNRSQDFENFDNITGTSSGIYIVPNTVHFIRFGTIKMNFMEAVCVLAALKNQRPNKLVIHTDHVEQGGKYWDIVTQHPMAQGVLEVRFLRRPYSIFGKLLSWKWGPWHAADVARLEVLMAEGGIFLDGDSYIVRNLNPFRRFEMTLGWKEGGGISNQVLIAHKDARFLLEWYNNYKDYNRSSWFYNAGERPTEIIRKKPLLVHRVRRLIAEYGVPHWRMIYGKRSKDWTKHYVIHLMIGWGVLYRSKWKAERESWMASSFPTLFDELSILDYEASIQDMASAVYPFGFDPNDTAY